MLKICGSISLMLLSIFACKKADKAPLIITEPTINTKDLDPASITDKDATISITLLTDGNSPIKTIGYCWSRTNPMPTIDDVAHTWVYDTPKTGVTYNTKLDNLNPFDTYYVRAYATNEAGKTGYGETRTFKTKAGTVTDIEGNVYHTITIGNQVWMQENLKTILLNDGSGMTNGNISNWGTLGTTPAFCVNPNVNNYKNTYGLLYNWHAVNTGKLAPIGWHVSTSDESDALIFNYLGGETVAGGKMKDTSTINQGGTWELPNTGATNSSGFTGLAGGGRSPDGTSFYGLNKSASFWTSSKTDSGTGISFGLDWNFASVGRYHGDYGYGHSVRCVRDLPAKN